MSIKPAKVGIVGAGNVGAAIANALVLLGKSTSIVLFDRKLSKAEGQAWDISDAVPLLAQMDVMPSHHYDDWADADIIVVTVGASHSGLAGYCACKFAVEAFSSVLRLEVSKADHIRITVIETGFVDTDFPMQISDPDLRQSLLDSVASLEHLQPEDVAAAVVYAVTQPPRVAEAT